MSYSMTETPTTTNINVEGQPAPSGSVEFDANDFGEQDAPRADVELLQHVFEDQHIQIQNATRDLGDLRHDVTGIWRTLNLISQANNESQRQMTALTNVVDNLSVTMAKLAEAVAARQPTVVTPVQLSTPTRLDGSFEGIAPTNLFMSPMTGSVQAGNTSLSTGSGDVDDKPFTDPATGRTWIVPGFITCARVQHKDSYSPEERKAISKLKTPKINKDDTSTLVDFLTSVDWHKHALYNDD